MGAYDLSGRLTVGFHDDDVPAARLLAAEMDPFRPTPASAEPPDVALEPGPAGGARLLDVQNPARDGTVTASDGERLLLVEQGLTCVMPDPLRDRPIRFVYEPGFPLGRIYARLVR